MLLKLFLRRAHRVKKMPLPIVDAAKTKAAKEADAVSADGDEQIAAIKNNSDSRRQDAVDVVLASFMAE